jgi:hypothetical protein
MSMNKCSGDTQLITVQTQVGGQCNCEYSLACHQAVFPNLRAAITWDTGNLSLCFVITLARTLVRTMSSFPSTSHLFVIMTTARQPDF